ncbi:MAG: family 4 glycosyl hydrolase [Anaerolineae bacterium]
MARKIVLIGAGSAMFTQGLVADLILSGKEWQLALVDIDPEALEVAYGVSRQMVALRNAPVTLSASLDRRDVLAGADVVVTTIGVGGRRAWLADVQIPRRYNIYQPVGDTIMAGGISRAMRMIPALVDIARDIQRLCPQALYINYANPMSVNCWAIRRAVGVPVVGLCIGVYDVQLELGRFIGAADDEISARAAGINHFTWVYELRRCGEDAWPQVRQRLAEKPPKDNPFSWSLFRAYGAYPAVNDRHVLEFFPERFPNGNYYGSTLGIGAYSIEQTIEYGQAIYERMRAQARGELAVDEQLFSRSQGEHGQLIEILEALATDRRSTYTANLPNGSLIPALPPDAILETTCTAGRDGLVPVPVTGMAPQLLPPIMRKIASEELTVQAALSGDRKLLVETMLLDGCITDATQAGKLVDELLSAHKAYLPQFA